MGNVVVVGAGIGGLAVSARLAKLGHCVTVCERSSVAGGAVRCMEHNGFRWDVGATSLTLPATVRDLFRKSGRPLERYVNLELRSPARRHLFSDGSSVDLPTGGRSSQVAALDTGLGVGAGQEWTGFVDSQVEVWEVLRTEVLDHADGGARLADRRVARRLRSRRTLQQLVASALTDNRLRELATYPFRFAGSAPSRVPAYAAVHAYVERSTGVWSIPGAGMGALTDALTTRLDERGVVVRYGSPVVKIRAEAGSVDGVEIETGEFVAADVVVTDVSPRTVFDSLLASSRTRRARRVFRAATPAPAVAATFLGLRSGSGGLSDPPAEVVLHGSPLLVVSTSGSAPPGHRAWSVWQRGEAHRDVLDLLADRGLDVRGDVVCRIDRSAADVAADSGGSPFGLRWDGYRADAQRARFTTPLPGLHLLGAGVHPGPSIPYAVWGAAHVAARIGRA